MSRKKYEKLFFREPFSKILGFQWSIKEWWREEKVFFSLLGKISNFKELEILWKKSSGLIFRIQKKIKARFEQQQQQKHRNFFFLISPTIRNNNPYNSNDKLDCYSFFFGFGFGNLPCFKTCTLFSHFSFFFVIWPEFWKKTWKWKTFFQREKKRKKRKWMKKANVLFFSRFWKKKVFVKQ